MAVINKVLKYNCVQSAYVGLYVCVYMLVCVLVHAYGGKRLVDACVFFGHFSFLSSEAGTF